MSEADTPDTNIDIFVRSDLDDVAAPVKLKVEAVATGRVIEARMTAALAMQVAAALVSAVGNVEMRQKVTGGPNKCHLN
ncbi:MAG: hypothetical protein M0T85_01915 [Dehalococcoidales bacterium]|nr:hypothetical protein [Dehalococcoidales bacterium]